MALGTPHIVFPRKIRYRRGLRACTTHAGKDSDHVKNVPGYFVVKYS